MDANEQDSQAQDALLEAVRVVSGPGARPVETDVAAAIAVLRVAIAEESELPHEGAATTDAWAASAKGLRGPIAPGPGAWRGFSG